MDSESASFLSGLGIDDKNPDIEYVEQKFTKLLKERIRLLRRAVSQKDIDGAEKWLRSFYAEFFQFSLSWAKDKRAGLKAEAKEGAKAHVSEVKAAAGAVLKDFQNQIIEYAVCYFRIYNFMNEIESVISAEEERMVFNVGENVKWTPDVAILIGRYRKKKKEILEQERKFDSAEGVLRIVEKECAAFKALLESILPKDKSEQLMRSYTAALRLVDAKKVRRFFRDVEDAKKKFGADKKTVDRTLKEMRTISDHLADIIDENEETLMAGGDKIFLRASESSVVRKANRQELIKMNLMMVKYHLPYMRYKRDSLVALLDKMAVFGSIDEFNTMYKKLLGGIVVPVEDIAALRKFENEVLGQVTYLLDTGFKEVQGFLERGRQVVEEFHEHQVTFKKIETEIREMVTSDEMGSIEGASKD
jgi:hypothetical protein